MAQIILDSNNNLIQGDFDNATLNNRTKLQTTTTNATTNVYVVPNGSSTSAGVSVANNSSLTNASKIVMATNGSTDTQIISGINGSGTYLPMSFYTNNALAAQLTTAGDLSFNSGYGSAAVAYGCRAWVNYDGTANTNLTGTYSQSGTTVTVTASNHGLIAGNQVYADATTGTAVDGTYTVTTVTSSSVFTYTAGTSLTTSGNITLRRNTIRGSGNVSSVTDSGIGQYSVNFMTAMPDGNYCVSTAVNQSAPSFPIAQAYIPILSTGYVAINVAQPGTADYDASIINVAIFR